jgi:TolB-like protein/DNA-binding winged helix-turn-helix (wHTH) protein/Tfp pilus assembly protein PilF
MGWSPPHTPMSSTPTPQTFRFGLFELDVSSGELHRAGRRVVLQGLPLQVLHLLVERAGEVVTRAEVQRRLWPADTFVDFDAGLNTAVHKLRVALNDAVQNPRFVETVGRRGYRFIAPVVPGPIPVPADPPLQAVVAEAPDVVATVAATPAEEMPRKGAWPGAWVGLLVILAFGVGTWALVARSGRIASVPRQGRIRSLAVLPLDDLSADPSQVYFADGMTDELTAQLAGIHALRVISRTSASRYKNSRDSLPKIAAALGVDGILEGSVTRSGGRVRVTAQLIDARSDEHIWAQTFEREMADVLALQADLAQAVAREVQAQVSPAEQTRFAGHRSVAPEVYEHTLRGRFQWNKRSPEGFRLARAEFQAAVDLDPTWAPGWAGLADTLGLLGISGYDLVPPAETMPQARAAAERALRLDPQSAEAEAALAWVLYSYVWDFPASETAFQRAIALDPNYATAYQWYGDFLCAMGRLDEASARFAQALTLDPLSLQVNEEAAWPDYYAHRFEISDARYRRLLELEPRYATAHLELGANFVAQARFAEAQAEYQRYVDLTGERSVALGYFAHARGLAGDSRGARALLAELEGAAARGYVPAYQLGLAYLGLGEREHAIEWFERSRDQRSDFVLYLGVDPFFDSLRNEPRFASLLRSIGLPAPPAAHKPRG